KARKSRAKTPPVVERQGPEAFLALMDWAYLAVHNGDLDCPDNPGLRAIYDWTRDETSFKALDRWIESGHDAELLKMMGHDPEVPLNTKLAQRKVSLDRIAPAARKRQ